MTHVNNWVRPDSNQLVKVLWQRPKIRFHQTMRTCAPGKRASQVVPGNLNKVQGNKNRKVVEKRRIPCAQRIQIIRHLVDRKLLFEAKSSFVRFLLFKTIPRLSAWKGKMSMPCPYPFLYYDIETSILLKRVKLLFGAVRMIHREKFARQSTRSVFEHRFKLPEIDQITLL